MMNPTNRRRLEERAEQAGCSVDEYLTRLLDLDAAAPDFQAQMLNAIEQAIIVTDLSGHIRHWNRHAEVLYGWPADEVLGRSVVEVTPAAAMTYEAKLVMQRLAEGRSWSGEFEVRRKDGTTFLARVSNHPILDEAGQLIGIMGMSVDITDQARIQQQQLESGRFISGVLRAVPSFLYVYDLIEDHNIFANDGLTSILGFTLAELKAMGSSAIPVLIHPEDQLTVREGIAGVQAATDESYRYSAIYRLRHKAGGWRWVQDEGVIFKRTAEGEVQQILGSVTDITERIETQEALRESETYYKRLTEMVSDYALTTLVNPDGSLTFEWIAGGFEATTGYKPEEAVKWRWAILRHPDDMDRVQADIARTLQGEQTTSEYRIRLRDGNYRWIRVTRRPIWDAEQGRVVRFYSAVKDITERKQAEEALRHSENLLREVLAAVRDVVYAINLSDLRVLYMSDAVEAITGYPAAEFHMRRHLWLQFIHPEDVDAVRGGEQLVMAQGSHAWDYRILRPDGEIRWVNNRAWLVHDATGEPARIVGVITDITERRRTQEMLELQNAALESAANAIVITDRDANIEWVNAAFTRLTGYSFEEARGKNPNALVKSGRHDEAFYRGLWDTILAGRVWFGRLINQRKDGTLYIEEQTITPVYDNDGQIRHFIAVKQDISAREHDEQIRLDHERLKARFQKEQEQNVLIQRTIAALSHDLRTPLTVIATTKDILSRYFDQLSDERRQEKLDNIGRQLQYAIELLDDTVKVAKSNLNHRIFRPAAVDLAMLCRLSIEEVNTAHGATHNLRFINPGEVAVVTVDEILVSRILVNLLSNAIKYSPAGGEIRLELDQHEDWITLRVIDFGIGISTDDLPYIFDPFYRSDEVMSIDGTGLGLSIVRDCVDRHGGHIAVESVPEQGTIFTVELPYRRNSIISPASA